MPPARPNSQPLQSFTNRLRQLNGYAEQELREWLFEPGMRFGEAEKWWHPGSPRTAPHEGLDILIYLDDRGREQRLSPGTKIPPLLSGVVAGVITDFLGKTVILAHDCYDLAGRRLHTFYAHLEPAERATISATIRDNKPIGKIAGHSKGKSACPPHLHLSVAWVDPSLPIQTFRWVDFCYSEAFQPIDPLHQGTVKAASASPPLGTYPTGTPAYLSRQRAFTFKRTV